MGEIQATVRKFIVWSCLAWLVVLKKVIDFPLVFVLGN